MGDYADYYFDGKEMTKPEFKKDKAMRFRDNSIILEDAHLKEVTFLINSSNGLSIIMRTHGMLAQTDLSSLDLLLLLKWLVMKQDTKSDIVKNMLKKIDHMIKQWGDQ